VITFDSADSDSSSLMGFYFYFILHGCIHMTRLVRPFVVLEAFD